jgi:hypothetical protein
LALLPTASEGFVARSRARGVVGSACIGEQKMRTALIILAYFGVARAGYAFREELPIFLVIFLLPAIVAVVAQRWLR